MHTERVIPTHPTAAVESDILRRNLQLRCILITNRQPKSTIGRQNAVHLRHPAARPFQILLSLKPIVVLVVLVTYVERWIGKSQLHAVIRHLRHLLNAITLMNLAQQLLGHLCNDRLDCVEHRFLLCHFATFKP